MKVVFDVSVLGIGHFYEQARTGVYRVAENILNGLLEDATFDLAAIATEFLPESKVFLQQRYKKHHIELVNSADELRKILIESKLQSLFPQGSVLQKATRRIVGAKHPPKPKIDINLLSKYDIYYSPYQAIPAELRGKFLPRKIITVHDLIPLLFPQYIGDSHQELLKKVTESIDENTTPICVSDSTKNDLCEYLKIDEKRVKTVHLAASKEKFYQVTSNELLQRVLTKYAIGETPYLLSLATFEPRKNIQSTIKAFAQLVQQEHLNDLNLVLVGTKGWQFDEIFKEIESDSNLKSKIIVTGFVDDADLAALYSGALAFVYPSLYEGFGLPPLEAMQCGTPVISSNKSSIPEVVGDAGILLEPNDIEAIAAAMLKFYSNSMYREHLSKLSLQQAAKFSWEKTVSQYKDIFKAL